MLTSAFATAAFVAACGGANKKSAVPFEEAGAAGEGPEPSGGTGGAPSGAGAKGTPEPSAGEAGMAEAGGAGGAPEAAGAAGEAGSPPIQEVPVQVLFTVAPGAKGLGGTAVAKTAHPSSVIFGSTSPTPDAVNGTNEVIITAAQLGIDDNDTIDAFTVLSPAPASPLYLFSVQSVSGEQGERPTRLNRSSMEDGAPGDVYFSDTTVSYRWLGEGGDQLGYNGLIADEQSLGLSSVLSEQNERDDLTGVVPLLDHQLPTTIYFSVSRDSGGVAGTAVSASAVAERGCTVFKSTLNGQNSVAYTCAQLGLASAAEVKGLSLISSVESPVTVLFTIDNASDGVAESGVAALSYKANYVYSSTGDGTNAQEISGQQLGLDYYDAIDALAVLDQKPAAYDTSSTCDLTPGPLEAAGANLTDTSEAHGLGPNLILVAGPATGPNDSTISAVGAYNVKTCAFVARAELGTAALEGAWAPVPLAGWTAAAPLKKLEYWLLGNSGQTGPLVLSRLDATGALVNSYGFAGSADLDQTGFNGFQLDYDATNDRLVGVISPRSGIRPYVRIVLDRPASTVPDDTLLDVHATPLPHPCAFAPEFTGIDGDGNSYFAQWDYSGYPSYRVCPLSPTGEFNDLPFSVSVGTAHTTLGMIVPGDSIYALVRHSPLVTGDPTTFELARQALTVR